MDMLKSEIVIIIPIYNSSPTGNDIISLRQCIKVLNRFPITFITHEKIDVTKAYLDGIPDFYNYKIEHFDSVYFQNIRGYNRLLLSDLFYKRFLNYKYILIYQLDAWIFKDDLLTWCGEDYDYVGAPWINWEWSDFYARHLTFPRRIAYRLGFRDFNLVGNGGFSLRKVSAFVHNLKLFRNAAMKFQMNEDYFYSFFVSSFNPFFRIPTTRKALQFSFDENPADAYKQNNSELPMACHAWPKYKEFWRSHIPDIDN
jgi:hypothetical protein